MAAGPWREPIRTGCVPMSKGTPRMAALLRERSRENGTRMKVTVPSNGPWISTSATTPPRPPRAGRAECTSVAQVALHEGAELRGQDQPVHELAGLRVVGAPERRPVGEPERDPVPRLAERVRARRPHLAPEDHGHY